MSTRPRPETQPNVVFAIRAVLSGSIDCLGTDFQLFRINVLELVDETHVSWNR
jgi:hypothetical protein